MFDIFTEVQHHLGTLPRKLMVQTDNCVKVKVLVHLNIVNSPYVKYIWSVTIELKFQDLKNQYVLSFYYYLVQVGVFEEVLVSHMPVGHTVGCIT